MRVGSAQDRTQRGGNGRLRGWTSYSAYYDYQRRTAFQSLVPSDNSTGLSTSPLSGRLRTRYDYDHRIGFQRVLVALPMSPRSRYDESHPLCV